MTQGPYGSGQPDPWSPGGQDWGAPETQQSAAPSPDPSWNGPGSTASEQPPTGQADWGNPNWSQPDPTWQPPAQTPYQPVQNPYQPTQTPYQPGPYPPAPYAAYTPTGAAAQHSSKGVVAIWLVGAAIVISFILSWIGGQAIVDLYHATGITLSEGGDYPDTSATDGPLMTFGFTIMLQVIPSGLGIAGLIVGALGIKYPNARTLGIVSLILAILAPFISLAVLGIAAAPAL